MPDEASASRPAGDVCTRIAYHPVALACRFLLELVSLAAFGYWGWSVAPGPLRWLTVVALPVAMAVAWGVFAVAGDRSRSGRAPVPVAGAVRLLLELFVFFGAAVALAATGAHRLAVGFATVLVLYHLTAFARIRWLVATR